MIIWSGWGFLVIFFFLGGCLLGLPIGALASAEPGIQNAVTIIVGGLAAGLGSFLFARKIEGGPGRAFIDEATQQRIVVGRSAGSLFFIPTRYWAYVAPALAVALGVMVMMSPGDEARAGAVAPTGTPVTAPVA